MCVCVCVCICVCVCMYVIIGNNTLYGYSSYKLPGNVYTFYAIYIVNIYIYIYIYNN